MPKRKNIRHIALSAMRGRKNDTKLLLFVIILVFLFISLSQILLASIAKTDHVRRTDLYGTWQVMFHGASEEKTKALRKEIKDASLSVLPIAGYTQDNRLIASFDDKTMALGNFKLKEGRLPEAPDEIAMVGSGNDAELSIGSTVTVKYLSDHTLKHYTSSESILDQYAPLYPYLPLNDMRIVREFEQWWAEKGGSIIKGVAGYETYPRNLSECTALQYRALFAQWMLRESVPGSLAGAYWTEQFGKKTTSNDLIGYEGITITIQRLMREVSYYGDEFGGYDGNGLEGYAKPWFTKVQFSKEYKVTGLIEPYEERWDTEGFEMPSAFVTPEECQFIHNAMDAPREKFIELPPYEPQSIVLFAGSPKMASSLYEQGLPVYEDGLTKRFKISKLQKGFGKYGGYITGLDREGNEVSLPYEGEGGLLKVEHPYQFRGYVYTTVEQLRTGTFYYESVFPMPIPTLSADKAYASNEEPYRINRYAYPPDTDIAVQLQTVMSVSLSAVSFCAVFLISLTQLRRRSKRIALTRAIGASKGQTVKLLAWETWYQLAFGVPLGLLIGFILSFIAVKIFGASYSVGMVFSIDVGALILGILGGVISVLFSMALSGLYAMQIPLISGAEKAPKKISEKPRAKLRKRKKMTRLSLVRREITFNRGRSLAAFALSFLLILSTILAVFLGSNSFARWREIVYLPDKPDYVVRVPYRVSKTFLEEIMEEIGSITDINRIIPYHAGENLSLMCEELLPKSPRLTLEYEKNPPGQSGSAFSLTGGFNEALNYYKRDLYREPGMDEYLDPDQDDGSGKPKVEEVTSVFVDLLCFDFDLYPAVKDFLEEALAEGDVDWERLTKGETCLVLSPLYDDELQSSTNRNDRHLFYRDNGVEVGDVFRLKGHTQSVDEVEVDVLTRENKVEVSGIIHYFPDRGFWPLSDEPKHLTLISGEPLLKSLYHLSGKRMDAYQSALFEIMSQLFQPDCMGKSYFCLFADPKAEGGMLDIAVHQWAASHGFHVTDYRMANRSLYTDAQSSMLMTVLLAAGVIFITLTILVNTNQSTAEANKKRTGILQAIGLTKKDFLVMQVHRALPSALIALLLSHGFVAGVLVIISVIFEGVSPRVLIPHMAETFFWQYPWTIHAALCILFVVLSVVIAVNPMRKVASESAIDNIRD
ncbi:MAG: ABC transporter permease [Saccharofermentanales bacterium]